MTEEINLQEQLKAEQAKLLEEKQKMLEELNALKLEKRNAKIAEYKKLCTEKNVKEKDVSSVSEDALALLVEQLQSIVITPTKDKEFKSVVATKEEVKDVDNFMMERENGIIAIWEMPNVQSWSALHNSHARSKPKQWS